MHVVVLHSTSKDDIVVVLGKSNSNVYMQKIVPIFEKDSLSLFQIRYGDIPLPDMSFSLFNGISVSESLYGQGYSLWVNGAHVLDLDKFEAL